MNEYIKAIKVIHQLLILAASAVLAFALSPNLEARYEKADSVLKFLQSLDRDSWDRYVFTLTPQDWDLHAMPLRDFVHHIDPSSNSEPKITPFIYSDLHYPAQSSVIEIVRYIQGDQRLQTIS